MATLKDLIRAETLKVGSRGAMPSNQIIALVEKTNFTSPNGESVRYVAPCDGVLSAFLQAAGRDGNATPGVNIADGDGRRHAARTTDGSVHMNLRKGNSATVSFYEAREHIEQWIVRFTKTIGGGYKQYLSSLSHSRFGGALWLRLKTTSETLPRLAAGLPLRRQGGFLSRPLSTRVMKRGDTKPLLQSASSLSNLSTQTSVTGISKTRLHTPILAGQLSASAQGRATCPVTRAMQSRTTLGAQADKPRMQVPLRSTSFLLSVASNNARMEVAA